jgi:UDP-glucose 4-epimerase
MGRRILITGLDTFWGARAAAALENDPDVETILGMGTGAPPVALERTEYIKADQSYTLVSRIVRATAVDTIVHTFLVLDSTQMSSRKLHEANVIGTMNLLAAAGAPGSSVRHLVLKSSTLYYGSNPRDPQCFSEDMAPVRRPHSSLERSIAEVEALVKDFALDNPDVVVTILRFANVLGADLSTPISRNLGKGVLPVIAGFDPLVQFVEEQDVVRALEMVTLCRIPGVYNVAGAGTLPWSEVARIAGARVLYLPPVMTSTFAAPLQRMGLIEVPSEHLDLLRFGRGVDTHKLVERGFRYSYTSAGAVRSFARAKRLRSAVGGGLPRYSYEADVEAFFKHSPSVVRDPQPAPAARQAEG